MFYVYLLKDKEGRIYIGYSKDLRRRISEHICNKVYTSKRMNKTELFYYEAYPNIELAKEREKKLKQHGSSLMGLLKRLKLK